MYKTILGAADDIVMGYSTVSSSAVLNTGDAHPVFVSVGRRPVPAEEREAWAATESETHCSGRPVSAQAAAARTLG